MSVEASDVVAVTKEMVHVIQALANTIPEHFGPESQRRRARKLRIETEEKLHELINKGLSREQVQSVEDSLKAYAFRSFHFAFLATIVK